MSIKRLTREWKEWEEAPLQIGSAGPVKADSNDNGEDVVDGANLRHWEATVMGPNNTPYEGGVFFLDLQFPDDYPFRPPLVKFTTRLFHCNINCNEGSTHEGRIELAILKDHWSPGITTRHIVMSIAHLLMEPNSEDPVMAHIGQLYRQDREKHDSIAREWTSKYAM